MLDGIGKKFELHAAIIQSIVPLPSFSQARSRLALAELTLDKQARAEGAHVLAVHDERGGSGDRGDGGRGGGNPPGGGRGGGNQGGAPYAGRGGGRGAGGGRGRGDAPPGGGCGSHQQPWLAYFTPVGMPFPPPRAPWIPPNSAGILAPRPGAPTHAYPVI
ncbi:hypothetical protein D1007_26545 [Hordeum vulgare]|nr:hypothetical protein D1007_26545 [Hordeum vulgare]